MKRGPACPVGRLRTSPASSSPPLVPVARQEVGAFDVVLDHSFRHPEVEECINYRLPAFCYRGSIIAGFSATSTGGPYYPFSGTT
jgi:hypothetical protein